MDLWTIDEAACLLLGYEPLTNQDVAIDAFSSEFSVLKRLLIKEVGKKLHPSNVVRESGQCFWAQDIIRWGETRALSIPQKLKEPIPDGPDYSSPISLLLERIQKLKKETEHAKDALKRARAKPRPFSA
ncbi:MAG: hypothetical protein ABI612_19100 [Betaproteobacteria bacterium]